MAGRIPRQAARERMLFTFTLSPRSAQMGARMLTVKLRFKFTLSSAARKFPFSTLELALSNEANLLHRRTRACQCLSTTSSRDQIFPFCGSNYSKSIFLCKSLSCPRAHFFEVVNLLLLGMESEMEPRERCEREKQSAEINWASDRSCHFNLPLAEPDDRSRSDDDDESSIGEIYLFSPVTEARSLFRTNQINSSRFFLFFSFA
jgi:hypothetical protein